MVYVQVQVRDVMACLPDAEECVCVWGGGGG